MLAKPPHTEAGSGLATRTTKPLVEKYTTHLQPATVKAIKREAFEREISDYQVVQEALDAHFRRQSDKVGREQSGD